MKKQYSAEEIFFILREADKGISVTKLCNKYNISNATFVRWLAVYANMSILTIKLFNELEQENKLLRNSLSASLEERARLQEAINKKRER